MRTILLFEPALEEEIAHWKESFPQYQILCADPLLSMTEEEWAEIEVIYGCTLSEQDLSMATQLRWIHCPTPELLNLCREEIEKRGNILLTYTEEENRVQIGEYVFGAILSFAKNIFHWRSMRAVPRLMAQKGLFSTMWSLDSCIFLQIGGGLVNQELIRRAQQFGMRIWGVEERRSFRPLCHKMFSYADLHSVLPSADVVCVHLPPFAKERFIFGEKELALLKEDAILVVLGSRGVDFGCLQKNRLLQRLRGVIIDSAYPLPIPDTDVFWASPQILVTPGVSTYPKKKEGQAVKNFTYNLRQYVQKNYADMKNLVNPRGLEREHFDR